MSFEALQERLTALQETTSQVRELIDRLAQLDFQPGSAPLLDDRNNNDDEENVAAELAAEINQILREEEEDLELLAEEVTDLRGGRDGSEATRRKERLRDGVARLDGQVKSCRITFHRAQLAARRSLTAARRLERQILLQSYTRAASTSSPPPRSSGANSPAPSLHGPPRRRHTQKHPGSRHDDDPVAAASSDLTQSLHRARRLVEDELARSVTLHESLAESTGQLRQLGGTYGRMEDMLASSRDLLGTLMKSTKSDTWYLETTFYLLLATLGWLVFRRWMYGPLWWVVWLPLRIMFRTGSTAVGMAGGGAGKARMEVVDGTSGRGVEVQMGEDGAVPTAKVGGGEGEGEGAAGGDPDSLVEEIGRIVDRAEEQLGVEDAEVFVPASDAEGDPPGLPRLDSRDGRRGLPVEEVVQDGRVRDEL